jgi:hypothetical protein
MGVRRRAERMLKESEKNLDRMALWIMSTSRDERLREKIRNETLREVLGLEKEEDADDR